MRARVAWLVLIAQDLIYSTNGQMKQVEKGYNEKFKLKWR